MKMKREFGRDFFVVVLSLLGICAALFSWFFTMSTSSLNYGGNAYAGNTDDINVMYISHLNHDNALHATIEMTNIVDKKVRVTLSAYNKDGLSLGIVTGITRLNPNETKSIDAHALPAGAETLKIKSNGGIVCNVVFRTTDGRKSEVIPAIREPSRQLDFPALVSYNDLYIYKTITLLNPNTTHTSIDVVAFDKNGYEIDRTVLSPLSSMESKTFSIAEIFDPRTLKDLSTVRATSDSNIVGLQLVDYPAVDLVGIPALTTTSKGWMFPIATKGKNFDLWTKAGILNPGNNIANVTVEAYDASNNSLGIIHSQTIFPGATYLITTANRDTTEGDAIPLNTAILKVTSNQPVIGYEVIGVLNGSGLLAVMGISDEDHTTMGFELTGAMDGCVLRVYSMVRMGDGSVKSTAGSLGSEEWTENVSTIPGTSEIISAPTAAIGINKNAGDSQNNGTSSQSPIFGLTIITHGYQLFGAYPKWVDEMAEAIANRFGGDDKMPVYSMKIEDSKGKIIAKYLENVTSAPDFKSAGGAIIKVDWSDISCNYTCLKGTSTVFVGDAVFTKLATDLSGAWLRVPIHLIGHSRGASVNSRLAYELGGRGIWVDHCTTLDPQPVKTFGDFKVEAWENVLFADNNYRRMDTSAPPWGEHVDGTYERKLNGIVKGDGYSCDGLSFSDNETLSNGTAHEQVHTYYHGTILFDDACVDNVLVQPEWYEPKYPTRRTGYYFSRIGKGDRYSSDDTGIQPLIHPRDGLHYRLSKSNKNNREDLNVSKKHPALPNVTFKPFADQSEYEVNVGEKVVFTYYYQDADSKLDIMFALDDDTNPFNDSDNSDYKEIGTQPGKAKRGTISAETTFEWVPTDADIGTHYVQIKAADASKLVRYDYLLKPINVETADNSPSISITYPASGATVSGTITVTANATDDKGITKVEFYLDGSIKSTDTSSPYSWQWDTTQSSNGSHVLKAIAYNTTDKTASNQINVTVNNTTDRPALVEKSGQITSYSATGGEDGDLKKGVAWPLPRFTDNGNGTVTDNLTGLIWLKNANAFGYQTWAQALADANGLSSGSAGLSDSSKAGDWRLPNVNELQSLIDFAYSYPALSNTLGTSQWTEGNPFIGVQSYLYWSSTTYSNYSTYAWYVYLYDGYVYYGSKTSTYYVWPVRAGQ